MQKAREHLTLAGLFVSSGVQQFLGRTNTYRFTVTANVRKLTAWRTLAKKRGES